MSNDAIDLKTPEAPSRLRLLTSLRPISKLQSAAAETVSNVGENALNEAVSNGSQSSGMFSFFSGMSLFRYFLVILILAFLGINLFGYMEVVTNYIVVTFKPILSFITSFLGISIAETTKATVDVTSTGLKKGIDITSDTLKKGANVLKEASLPNKIKENNDNMSGGNIIDTLDDKVNNKSKLNIEPLPDSSNSSIQNKPKKNYCYIGANMDGTRTCAEMGSSDKCMSGDIFPSLDICINPNLR